MKINHPYFIRVALLLFFCQIAASMTSPYISVFLSQKINATNEQIGIYVSLSSIASMLFSILIATVIDKTKKYKCWISISIFSAAIGYFIYSISTVYMQVLIVSITLLGVATCLTALIYAYAKDLFTQNNIDEEAVSSLRVFVSLAWVIGPLLGAYVYEKRSYEGLFKSCSTGYIVAWTILFVFWGERNNNFKDEEKDKNYSQVDESVFSIKRVYIACYFSIFVMLQTINSVLNTNIPLYITEILGFENKYVGWISSLNAIMEIPVTMFFLYISQKKDIRKLISFGMVNGIIFIFLLMIVKNIFFIMGIYVIKAIFVSIFMSLGIAFFQDMIPKKYGVSTILYTNTTRVGNMVSGALIGFFTDNYIQLFLVLIIICFGCLLAFRFVNNKVES